MTLLKICADQKHLRSYVPWKYKHIAFALKPSFLQDIYCF